MWHDLQLMYLVPIKAKRAYILIKYFFHSRKSSFENLKFSAPFL